MNDSSSEGQDAERPAEGAHLTPDIPKPAARRAPRKKAPAAADSPADAVVQRDDPANSVAGAAEVSPPAAAASLDAPATPVAGDPGMPEKADSAAAAAAGAAAAAVASGPSPSPSERGPRPDASAAGQGSAQPREAGKGGKQRKAPGRGVDGYQFADVVSGRFDEDEAAPETVPGKRVLAPQVETPKLHKVLAQAGLGSRLEMEQLILEGRISVNNEPAHIGQRIQYGDQVKVNGKPIRYRIDPPPARVIAYHKPVGEVVTHDDPQNRPTVFRKLPRLAQGKWQSVGRLDLNTEGLLLFTSSGELANKLMHPRFGLEREYAVRVLGALSNEEKQRLLDGVRLDDGMASFGSIEDGGGEGSNCWYRVTISEGRNREVRRMMESVGHAVSRLIRIRYGAMVLPRGLKRGAWLELDDSDIRALMQAAGAGQGAGRSESATGRADAGAAPGRGGRGGSNNNARNRGGNGPRGGNPAAGGAQRGPKGRRDGQAAGDQRGSAQPDPMKTSVGYIGMDSLSRHRQDSKRRPGGGGSRRGGR
ncbi:pseudouridine synthase [Paracidovorax sp. MALMAid1276]|uniref:pseudouridine synthase n=1 Tax=Paracidovorax sp. MALMAid1276 TaxID=3411631 RepID=UPI003B9C8389